MDVTDVTDVTMPTLLQIPELGLTVAAYTDGFDSYLANEELREIAALTRENQPRLVQRRGGGWLVETTPTGRGSRPVVLARAVIAGEPHYLTGEGWPWSVSAAVASRPVRDGGRRQ